MVKEASCADPPGPTVPPDIPKPSVPQFTLAYADHSYDVPAKTKSTTDPYTGQVTTTTIPGYHIKNYTIDGTIKNHKYPATINHGNTSVFVYGVQAKGHYEPEDSFWSSGDGMVDGGGGTQSNSEYTVISIQLSDISSGTVDIRVQASLGYYYTYHYGLSSWPAFASADSGWSSVQTFTIPGTSPSANPTAEPIQITISPSESQVPNNMGNPALDTTSILVGVIVALIIVIAALAIVFSRKIRIAEAATLGS